MGVVVLFLFPQSHLEYLFFCEQKGCRNGFQTVTVTCLSPLAALRAIQDPGVTYLSQWLKTSIEVDRKGPILTVFHEGKFM